MAKSGRVGRREKGPEEIRKFDFGNIFLEGSAK